MRPEADQNQASALSESERAYRREVALQIYLPLTLGVLILGGLTTWIGFSGSGSASLWADLSLAFLLVPVFLLGFLLLAFLAAIVYGVTLLISRVPEPARRAQEISRVIRFRTRKVADLAVVPWTVPSATLAALRRAVDVVSSAFRRRD
jgi:hypothetical protein